MKATGIVRRIDDLGRVVIPKEIRRTLRLREGDPLEIYTDEDGVKFVPYSMMDLDDKKALHMCKTLQTIYHRPVIATNTRDVIAQVGGHLKAPAVLTEAFIERLNRRIPASCVATPVPVTPNNLSTVAAIAPILVDGESIGSFCFISGDSFTFISDEELNGLKMAADFFGRELSI